MMTESDGGTVHGEKLGTMAEGDYSFQYSEKSLWEKISNVALRAGEEVIKKVLVLYYCMKDTDTPAQAKAVIVGTLGYFIFPFDSIPDMAPAVGFSDDLGALAIATTLVLMHIKPEHNRLAQEKFDTVFNSKR